MDKNENQSRTLRLRRMNEYPASSIHNHISGFFLTSKFAENNMNAHSHSKRLCGFAIAGLLSLLSLTGCGKGKSSITLAGSTAFQPFAEKLAEKYMQINPAVNVTVQGGGSAVGIQSALSGAADIGMADLVSLPPEAAALRSVTVAKDGIVVVVHPSNGTADLTLAQVRGIFNGTVGTWKQVGGPEAGITVVSREAGSGTRTSFEQIVGEVKLTGEAIIQDSNGTIRETVANDPNAVGYLSHGLLNDRIKAVTIDGVACTPESIVKGGYKLVRPIFFLTRGEPKGDMAGFIDYVLSPDAQKILQSSGLIPAR
jgi:phosphate transport system substrate-binding protein